MKINCIILLFTYISVFVISKQLILSKQNNNYLLKLQFGNLKINLNTVISLSQKNNWIKSEECKLCTMKTGIQQSKFIKNSLEQIYNDKKFQCSKSCFIKDAEDYGIKCTQSTKNCKIIKDNQFIESGSKVFKGKQIQIKVKDQIKHQTYEQFQIFLVQKAFDKIQTDKTKIEQDKSTQNDKLSQQKSKVFQQTIGQYSIWGVNSLYDDNILTKNNKHQLTIYDDYKFIQKQLIQDKSHHIQIQFQQSKQGQFLLSQLKLDQKLTNNHPQKIKQSHQFPILPLSSGLLSLQTQNLLLPQKQFNKIIKHIVDTYFSSQKDKCEYKNFSIVCEHIISLDLVEYLQLQLILNGISLSFPFKVLIKNCEKKMCQIKFGVMNGHVKEVYQPQDFVIGTFILDMFAIQFIQETQNIKFYRLNNQYGKIYNKDQKYKKQNYNIIWWIISSIFYVIWVTIKIIFYLAIFSLCINFIYHWKKIVAWLGQIFEKISKDKSAPLEQNQLFEQDEDMQMKDTSKLIRSYKQRNKRNIFQDQQNLTKQQQINTSMISQTTTTTSSK